MNVLMALAAVGAVGIGEYAEGAWVLVLFAVGTGLEAMALERSRRTVASLMELAPARARVIADGAERLVDVEAVEVGALIAIRPGERIALDANVESGTSSVDQAPITGESVPVDKQPGDELFAGTLNTTGALVARTTRPAADSTLSRVASLVEAAQGSRAPAERFIDRFAAIYTPLVFAAALTAGDRAAGLRRRQQHVAVPRARAADRGLPMLARDLGPGRRGLGRRRRGSARHPDQGRPGARGPRASPRRRARQDRDAHARAPPAPRRHGDRRSRGRARAGRRRRDAFRASARRSLAPRCPRPRARGAHGSSPSTPSRGAAPRRSSTAASCGPAAHA